MTNEHENSGDDEECISFSRRKLIQGSFAGAVTLACASDALAAFGDAGAPDRPGDGKDGVRLAVVQQDANPGKVDENRNKAMGFAAQALARRADIILFHEELLVGYVKNLRSLAEPANGVTTQAFQRQLQGTGSVIIYGLTEKKDDKYYISAVVVSESGVVANYHKTHLFPVLAHPESLRNEPAVYTPGDKLVTFPFKGYLCGLMICFDGDFPEVTRSYANLGCTMLFWMNNRGSRGHAEVSTLAFQNSMIIATSCCTGEDESGRHCTGGSNITGPDGELISEIWGSEGVIISGVSPGLVPQIRRENVFFTGQRPDLYKGKIG
jgi:predicted amidohydrolase